MAISDQARCPQCHASMEDGFIPTAGGLHWYRRRETSGVDFAESLPGTFNWDRRTRLPAWRCRKCQIVAFRFGHGIVREVENSQVEQEDTGDGDAVIDEASAS